MRASQAKTFDAGGASDFPFHSDALKTCFIVNPRSGCAVRALPQVRSSAATHTAMVKLTERSRHATEIALQALGAGCELIVAVGGDGTMNEVATSLVGTDAIFGLVPCGSGDGLGRHLGIHGSITRALEILFTGQPRPIDTGIADGHPFFTAAGIGFEAQIAQRFNQLHRRGFARYLTTSVMAFHQWNPESYTISSPQGTETVRAFTLTATNANQYGNNARIAPEALVDDGLIDLCTVPPVNYWNALPLARHLFHGTIDRVPGVIIRRGDRFTVERDAPGLLHTDGELHEAGRRIEFTVRPASLRIMVPA
ncbi:MAG: diacylglycerol/lipid kinase family protein [Opitutaceae bacterium]